MSTDPVNSPKSHLTNPEDSLRTGRLDGWSSLHLDGAGPPSARKQGDQTIYETASKILRALVLATALGGIGLSVASAATIDINPSKDNTLYEYVAADGDRSNARGDHFFAGKTLEGYVRRGVLAFNIAASIPPGSTIISASLNMNMSRTNLDTARIIELHNLLADWGEGTSNANAQEGQGAPATPNDATWRHRFYSTIFWTTQGGEFSNTVSASQSVDAVGEYTWSSAQMVVDVQSWLNNPSSNFGWLVL